jgi:hypothetical protein
MIKLSDFHPSEIELVGPKLSHFDPSEVQVVSDGAKITTHILR